MYHIFQKAPVTANKVLHKKASNSFFISFHEVWSVLSECSRIHLMTGWNSLTANQKFQLFPNLDIKWLTETLKPVDPKQDSLHHFPPLHVIYYPVLSQRLMFQAEDSQWFLKLTLTTTQSNPSSYVKGQWYWKTVSENGFFSCPLICLRSQVRFERCGIVSHNYANWQLVRYPPSGEEKWIDAWRHTLGKPFHVCWHRKNEREEAVISVAIIYVKHSKRRHCITPIFQEKGAKSCCAR